MVLSGLRLGSNMRINEIQGLQGQGVVMKVAIYINNHCLTSLQNKQIGSIEMILKGARKVRFEHAEIVVLIVDSGEKEGVEVLMA
jgi:hypothetical protein